MISVHEFDSTREAYDASQTDDRIKDGDVLVVKRECAVAVLIEAWPIAIALAYSGHSFHTSDDGTEPFQWAKVERTDNTTRDYSESLRVARDQLAGLPERKLFLVSSFSVAFNVRRGGPARNNTRVRVNIDSTGLVELDDPHSEEQRTEWIEFLTDEEIATWRAIGPEDSELFLTEEWLERFTPQIATLDHGWLSFGGEETASG